MDCLFCQRRNTRLYGRWYSRIRCCSGCGAFYQFRLPPVGPLRRRFTLSRWEPIKRPRAPEYYGYAGFLRMVFMRLRNGATGSEIAGQARAGVTMCDLIRFSDALAHERLLEDLIAPTAELLKLFVEQAKNPAIAMPELECLPQFHAICDFASWGLTRIAAGQMDQETAGHFGYDMHNFPRGGGYGTKELVHTYARAIAGELPTEGRLEIRARLRDQSR